MQTWWFHWCIQGLNHSKLIHFVRVIVSFDSLQAHYSYLITPVSIQYGLRDLPPSFLLVFLVKQLWKCWIIYVQYYGSSTDRRSCRLWLLFRCTISKRVKSLLLVVPDGDWYVQYCSIRMNGWITVRTCTVCWYCT